MSQDMSAVHSLLRRERDAAMRADVELLLELQREKSELFGSLTPAEVDDPEFLRACRQATENVQLLRHLVKCFEAMLGRDRRTYTPHGAPADQEGPGRSRGRI